MSKLINLSPTIMEMTCITVYLIWEKVVIVDLARMSSGLEQLTYFLARTDCKYVCYAYIYFINWLSSVKQEPPLCFLKVWFRQLHQNRWRNC